MLQELLKKYLEEDKIKELLSDMKSNKIYLSNEENIDTRYFKLKEQFDLKDKEHQEASKLIEELKKSGKDNEELQGKISDYETQIQVLKEENESLKLDNAIKIELLGNKAKASDIDYLMFKIKQGDISLDDKGNIKGFDIDTIKTSYPSNFEESSKKEVQVNQLPDINNQNNSISKEQFEKMGYLERNKLAQENPEMYNELSKN